MKVIIVLLTLIASTSTNQHRCRCQESGDMSSTKSSTSAAINGQSDSEIISRITELIRRVVRLFYDDVAIVIVDLLLRNPHEMYVSEPAACLPCVAAAVAAVADTLIWHVNCSGCVIPMSPTNSICKRSWFEPS
jgi:hypothetical protein